MKWPESLVLVRHGESAFNELKERKKNDPQYQEFLSATDPEQIKELAIEIIQKRSDLMLDCGDHNTPLTLVGWQQAEQMASVLKTRMDLPTTIFVSPYQRTLHTLEGMVRGWPELGKVNVVEEDRIIEQEHGLYLIYNDKHLFEAIHPEQKRLRLMEGSYWYKYPQGENVREVRQRIRSWFGALTRDYRGENVLAVTHHLSILALRANLERWSPKKFQHTDEHEKPINCGITIYRGEPNKGKDGKLVLQSYNEKLY